MTIKISIFKSAFVFLFLSFSFLTIQAQEVSKPDDSPLKWDNGIRHSAWEIELDDDEKEKMLSLWNEIGEDLKTTTNDLAGTYLNGGYTSGYFFRWSPAKGFVLISYFDQNLIGDFSYGKANFVDNSKLVFALERDLTRGRGNLLKTPVEWTAVKHLLVSVASLKDFGEYCAGLGKWNDFNGDCCEIAPNFLAVGFKRKKRVSYPIAPKYKHFIKSPISAQITFVGRKKIVPEWGYDGVLYSETLGKTALIPVKINAGQKSGVKKNMLFQIIDETGRQQYLQIISVRRRSSSGYVVREFSYEQKEPSTDYQTDEEIPFPPVRLGIKVTTGLLDE